MTLETAIGTLAAVSVSGVTKSYSLAEIRRGVAKPNLPALLPLPFEGQNERVSFGFVSDSFVERHQIRHRLLVRPVETSLQGEAMALTVELIDAYHEAIQTLGSHAGAGDIRVLEYKAGAVDWQGIDYHGCDFTTEIIISE